VVSRLDRLSHGHGCDSRYLSHVITARNAVFPLAKVDVEGSNRFSGSKKIIGLVVLAPRSHRVRGRRMITGAPVKPRMIVLIGPALWSLACSGGKPDLPPGWENAQSVKSFTQAACSGSPGLPNGPSESVDVGTSTHAVTSPTTPRTSDALRASRASSERARTLLTSWSSQRI
jgi:hypothetical protein